jgi:hypothetical protein
MLSQWFSMLSKMESEQRIMRAAFAADASRDMNVIMEARRKMQNIKQCS